MLIADKFYFTNFILKIEKQLVDLCNATHLNIYFLFLVNTLN